MAGVLGIRTSPVHITRRRAASAIGRTDEVLGQGESRRGTWGVMVLYERNR